MNKKQKIINELRALIKAPAELSDAEIIKITEGSLLKASVEFNIALEELSKNLRKELPFIEKFSRNTNNAILKLQNFINKKS